MKEVKVKSEQSPLRCPYCHDALATGKELAACGDCGARQHLTCHQEHGACTACSSNNVLVPQSKRTQPSYGQPLRGSKIRVEATEAGTRYTWRGSNAMPWALLILLSILLIPTIVLVPFMLLVLYQRWHQEAERDFSIVLEPDAIEFDTFYGEPCRVARNDVGRVQVLQRNGVGTLTIDVGVDRHSIYTTRFAPRLKAPELEWLAVAVNGWKEPS